MEHEITCLWQEDFYFQSQVNGHVIPLDASAQHGGKDRGATPKPLLLVALAGCTAMDVVSILKKMKVPFSYFNVRVRGLLQEELPNPYRSMTIVYEFKAADNLDRQKIIKAVELSLQKYCGVAFLLRKGCILNHEISYV